MNPLNCLKKKYKILALAFYFLASSLYAQIESSSNSKDGPFISIQTCLKKVRSAQLFGDTNKDPYDSKALQTFAEKVSDSDILKNFEDSESISAFRSWINSDIITSKEDLNILSLVEKKHKTNTKLSSSDQKELVRIYKNALQMNIKNTPKSFDLEHNFEYSTNDTLINGTYYILARNGNIYKTNATRQINKSLKQKNQAGVFEITLPVSKKSTLVRWSLDKEGNLKTENLTTEGSLKKGIQKTKLDLPKLANNESFILVKMFDYEIKSAVNTINANFSSDIKFRSAMKSALDFCKDTIKDEELQKTIDTALVYLERKTEIPLGSKNEVQNEKNAHVE
jgi:hypothetical protein